MTSAAFDRLNSGYYNSDPVSPTNPGGFGDDGHQENFPAALADIATVAAEASDSSGDAADQVVLAAAYAATALNAPGTFATSTSNVAMPVVGGTFPLTIQLNKLFTPLQKIGAARTGSETTTAVYGTVQSYNPATGALVIFVEGVIGAGGPYNTWTVALSLYGVITSRQILVSGGMLSGGGNLAADRTITLTPASAADAWGNNNTDPLTGATLRLMAAKQALAYAATIAWDTNAGWFREVTLTANAIMGLPTNIFDGQSLRLSLGQGGAGGFVITAWNTFFDFGLDGFPVLSTVTGKTDFVYVDVVNVGGTLKGLSRFRKAA